MTDELTTITARFRPETTGRVARVARFFGTSNRAEAISRSIRIVAMICDVIDEGGEIRAVEADGRERILVLR